MAPQISYISCRFVFCEAVSQIKFCCSVWSHQIFWLATPLLLMWHKNMKFCCFYVIFFFIWNFHLPQLQHETCLSIETLINAKYVIYRYYLLGCLSKSTLIVLCNWHSIEIKNYLFNNIWPFVENRCIFLAPMQRVNCKIKLQRHLRNANATCTFCIMHYAFTRKRWFKNLLRSFHRPKLSVARTIQQTQDAASVLWVYRRNSWHAAWPIVILRFTRMETRWKTLALSPRKLNETKFRE